MGRGKDSQNRSFVWPLLKAAAFWFLVAQAAILVTPSLELSPTPFVYFATLAFVVQSVGMLLGAIVTYGFSWKLVFVLVSWLALGLSIYSTLPTFKWDQVAKLIWVPESVKGWIGDKSTVLDSSETTNETASNRSVRPPDQLAKAADLVFKKKSEESLTEARQYLSSIPEEAPAYNSAQALLRVVGTRLDEAHSRKAPDASEKAPIEVITCEQKGERLRVTVRNNSTKSVRNIRYRAAYFRATDGTHIHPDSESVVMKKIAPRSTWTFEITDPPLKENTYAWLTILSWDSESYL
jgi:hypothetical protein